VCTGKITINITLGTSYPFLALSCAIYSSDIVNMYSMVTRVLAPLFRELNIFIYINGKIFRKTGTLQCHFFAII
jgi:hypothetical protein